MRRVRKRYEEIVFKFINPCANCGTNKNLGLSLFYHQVLKTYAFNAHCSGCDEGLGAYRTLKVFIERWNYHNPKERI